ncbi:mechanosensitive ion channel family protein [Marisediminicola sp. LYQ134]|uniref:mechanosensitive ion channel family protein n=1 Tax=unclassified Marisediminicola TaxID=2618316 RepID=UPI0039836FB0
MTDVVSVIGGAARSAVAGAVEPETQPFDWTALWAGVGEFLELFQMPITIIGIIVGAILMRVILHFVIRRVVTQVVSGVKKRQNVDDTQALTTSPLAAVRVVQRTRTLGTVLNNVVTVVIVIVALLLIVTAIDPNIIGSFALITAALGAGLGFGAQNIVKDVLNGLFMVAEDQVGVGDVVDLGEASGTVETVGIRVTTVRDVNGTLWFVRNGEILRVGNKSQGWARVIIDVPTPYHSDVSAVQASLLKTAVTMTESVQWRKKVLEAPEIWGIETLSAEALVIRLVVKVRPADQWDVARELRLRLKLGLDDLGVDLPALNRMVIDSPPSAPLTESRSPRQTADAPDPQPATKPVRKTPTRKPQQ